MPLGAFRQSLNLANPSEPVEPSLWSATIDSGTINNLNLISKHHNICIHGVSNGHLVGTLVGTVTSITQKQLFGWAYNISTGAFAVGSPVSMGYGSSTQFARVAGNGNIGAVYTLTSGYQMRGYQITNYASVSTTNLPTFVTGSTFTPFTGTGNGNTGQSISIDRTLNQFITVARNSGDRSTYARTTFTAPNSYSLVFSPGNLLSLNGVAQGRSNAQQLVPIPNSSMSIWIADNPNGNTTFVNVMGSTSERGIDFYGSSIGVEGQAVLLSHGGTGNTATATVMATGILGAPANSYRFRRISITNENTLNFQNALTAVTLTNGAQDYRIFAYKPNSSTDYLVLYRNSNTIYAAKVSQDGLTKTEYGAIVELGGYTNWSSNDSFLFDNTVYTANLMFSGTTGKIMITKFTG
jgi:hypothetical protein